jgi:iron complex transport system substrate-binding protein
MTRPTTTRRTLLGTGALAALALAGCGGGSSSSSSSSAAGQTTGGGGGMRTVKTIRGAVEVPAEPSRIVSVHPATVDALFDYGVPPVGVYDIGAENISPRYRSGWKEAAKIGKDGELDLSAIAGLEPDLIVLADYEWNTNYYARLGKIAPAVVAPSTEWQEAAHLIAAAAGRFEKLSELQKELSQASAKLRGGFARQLDAYKWDLVGGGGGEGGEYLVFGPDSGPGGVLTGAGVRLASGSAEVTNGEDASYSSVGVTGGLEGVVTGSEIGVLEDAGVIGFYADWDGEPKNEGALLVAPEFEALEAVKAGRMVPLPDFLPTGYGDALALLEQLEAGLKTI